MDAMRVYRAEGLAGLGRGGSAPGYGGGGGGTGGEGGTPGRGRTPGGLGIGNVPAGQPGRAPLGGVGSPGEPGGAGYTPGRPSRPSAIPGAPATTFAEFVTNPAIRAATAELIARGVPADLATQFAVGTIEGIMEGIRNRSTGVTYSGQGLFEIATTVFGSTIDTIQGILADAPLGVQGLTPAEIATMIRDNPAIRDAIRTGGLEGLPTGTTLTGVPGFNPVGPGGTVFGPGTTPTDPTDPDPGTAPSPETPGGGEGPGAPPPPAPEPPPVVPLRPLPPRAPAPAPDPGTQPPPPPPLEPPPETATPPGEPVAATPEGQLPDIIPDIEEPGGDDIGDELAGAGGGGAGRFRTGAFSGGRLPAAAERTDFDQGEAVFTRGARRNVYRPYPALAERTRRLRL